MNLENINLALAQIETSLKELDSARKQVGKVTESSSNLTIATTKLTDEVKKFKDKIGADIISVISEFSDKLKDFQEKSEKLYQSAQKNLTGEVEKSTASTTELRAVSENAIKEIKSLSVKTIKDQESEISKTIIALTSYCFQVQSLIDKLSTYDFGNQLDKIDENISSLKLLVQSIQSQIKSSETNISDKISTSSEKQIRFLSNFQEKLNQSLDNHVGEIKHYIDKKQTSTYITWVLIIIGIIVILVVKQA